MTCSLIQFPSFIIMPQTATFIKRKQHCLTNNNNLHQYPFKRSNVKAILSDNMNAKQIIHTFQTIDFKPLFSSNPHFQTIFSNYFPSPPQVDYNSTIIKTDDNLSSLTIDIANGHTIAPEIISNSSSPVVVVLHGLESNSQGIVTKRIVSPLTNIGLKVYVLNFRSCAHSNQVPSTLKLYHAGFIEDLQTLLREIRDQALLNSSSPPPVLLCGFSLGANMICQFLGQMGQDALDSYGVIAAAVACVPFDPIACQKNLDSGLKGAIYSKRLVSTMQKKFRAARLAGVDMKAVNPELIEKADRLGLIDDHFISPVFGFKNKTDYYRKIDSRKVLKHIRVPTLIINARDDPFFDHQSGESLPSQDQIGSAPVLLHVVDHGGHCGFFDKQTLESGGITYFQREFCRFFQHVLEHNQNEKE